MPPTLTDLSAEAIQLIAKHVMLSGTTPPRATTSPWTSSSRVDTDHHIIEHEVDGPFVRSSRSRNSSRRVSDATPNPFTEHHRYPSHPSSVQRPQMTSLDVLMSAASEVDAGSSSTGSSKLHEPRGYGGKQQDHGPLSPLSPRSSYPGSIARADSRSSTRSRGIETEPTEYSNHSRSGKSSRRGSVWAEEPEVYMSRVCPDPRALLPLMLTCKRLHKALNFDENPKLYSWMYMNTFDVEALVRRWKRYQIGGLNHTYEALDEACAGGEDQVKVKTEPVDMEDASMRADSEQQGKRECRHGSQDHASKCICREGVHLMSDPLLYANEYKERFEVFKRYREIAAAGSLKGLLRTDADKAQWQADIWCVWWIYMENNSKNFIVLESLAKFKQVVLIFYREYMLEAALKPGYPLDTSEGAILMIISNRLGIDKEMEETREQIETKVFILLPYVFAAHKYPFLYGPWVHRDLPLNRVARDEEELAMMTRPNAFMVELSPTPRSTNVKRLGKWWKVSAPYQTTVASLSFMQLLERHPELITLGKNPHVELPRPAGTAHPGSHLHQFKATKQFLDVSDNLDSSHWDNDLNRAMNCPDPISSPGMHPLAFRHCIEGTWKGKYLYFDYNAYQHMVKGDVRSLYEGAYGEELQEWRLEERVINVKIDKVGGDGPMLNAGFVTGLTAEDEAYEASLSTEERGWEPCLNENAPDRPGWTKEILISGTGLSQWGEVKIQGRVRAWDGLVTIQTDFGIPESTGKWLFRCYINSGNKMVGRYRDTFTTENMRGYEGPVFLQKFPTPPLSVSPTVPNITETLTPAVRDSGAFRTSVPTGAITHGPSDTAHSSRDVRLPHLSELDYHQDRRPEVPRASIPTIPTRTTASSTYSTERARLLAEHRAALASQPLPPLTAQSVLPVVSSSEQSLRMPTRLPPMTLPPYRRSSYIEADHAQMLWSRSLASDVGQKNQLGDLLSPIEEQPPAKRARRY